MITAVELPLEFQQQLRDEALRALPRECCGLLEGIIEPLTLSLSKGARVIALHPTANLSNASDRFEIDPASHIALLRKLRGTGRTIVGCYHSHPNGRAEPSKRDCESAVEQGFLWLICAIQPGARTTSIAAFLSTGECFSPLPIVNHDGAAGVSLASPNANRAVEATAGLGS